MHLQDIKQRILEKGLVSSGARSSLEAVIYRDTQRGSRRFRRVDGEIGVFRLIVSTSFIRVNVARDNTNLICLCKYNI